MQNSPFLDKIATLRNRLPDWMEWTVGGVYIISIVIGGLFLSKVFVSLGEITAPVAAFLVAIGSQVVRALIVFFDQLNPQRPAININRSYAAALVLGGLAIFEAVHLISAAGLPMAAKISVGGLMFAGMILEIYALRELQHATNYAFFTDPNKRAELEHFYMQKAEFKHYLKDLKNQVATGNFTRSTPTLPQQPSTPAPAPPLPEKQGDTFHYTMRIWEALGMAHELTPAQLNEINKSMNDNKVPEAETLAMIKAYSDINRAKLRTTAQQMRQNNAMPTLSPLRKILRRYFEENDIPPGVKADYENNAVLDQHLADNLMASYVWWDMPEDLRERVNIVLGSSTDNFEIDFSKNGNGQHH